MIRMKILNLFAGLGGNRTLWGEEHQITAVEYNQQIADIYKKRFPNDEVIVGDAYEYFLTNFNKYDIAWFSPSCQTHSWYTFGRVGRKYNGEVKLSFELIDMNLYSIILWLGTYFRGDWVVENVHPAELKYFLDNVDDSFKYLLKPTFERGRHVYWSNVKVPSTNERKGVFKDMGTFCKKEVIEQVAKDRLIDLTLLQDLDQYTQNQALRNMVMPEEGKFILECILNKEEKGLGAWL